jgi:uncharacterized protein YfaS (alpha-2-macroglobulin family)
MAIFIFMFMQNATPPFDFDKAWKEVESLTSNGVNKDALTKVEQIYNSAISEKNQNQRLKAAIYIAGYKVGSSEDGQIQSQKFFLEEISKLAPPYKNIMASYYAEFLNQYLQTSYYEIDQRAHVDSDFNLLTMSKINFVNEINKYIELSLQDQEQLKVKIDDLKLILSEDKGKMIYPTVFEMLAHKALNHYQYGMYFNEANKTEADDEIFGSAKIFIASNTSLKSEDKVIQLLRRILQFEIDQKNPEGQAAFDLKRIEYLQQNTFGLQKDKLVQDAYVRATKEYKSTSHGELFYIKLINLEKSSTKQDNLVKAEAVCKECIKELGVDKSKNCKNELDIIYSKSIKTKVLHAYHDSEKIEYQLTTKNIDKVYFKLLSHKGLVVNLNNVKEARALLMKAKSMKNWNQIVVKNKFFQEDKVNLFFDPLPLGKYILIASNVEDFSGALEMAEFSVTNLSYMTVNQDGKEKFIIVNRKTGEPISNATIKFNENIYDYRGQNNKTNVIHTSTSDASGIIKSNPIKNKGFTITVISKKDTFTGVNQHYVGDRYQNDQSYNSMQFYTDRSIYRPGQFVYFKAISINHNPQGKPTLIQNKSHVFTLQDANGQEVNKITMKSNDFGSMSGSFTLPVGKLTGSFTIQSEGGSTSFQVEEYKRPTFEVVFDTIKSNLKIGDKVIVTGTVKTYAGVNLANTKVNYVVSRSTIMPYCYRWFNYQNNGDNNIEIGETVTDADGRFAVQFTAEDPKDVDIFPIYNYNIKVDALNDSGESQSGEYSVYLSKYSKFLSTNFGEQFDLMDKDSKKISIENANGISQQGSGKYKISKLKEDISILKASKWNDNDNYYWFRSKPRKSKYSELAIEKIIVEEKFIDKGPLNLQKLAAGIYKLEASLDNNEAVAIEEYFVVTDFKNNAIPKSQLVFASLNQKSYKVGEVVDVNFISNKSKQQVYYVLSRNYVTLLSGWLNLNNKQTVKYKITEQDKGNIHLAYGYVNDNETHSSALTVEVPWTDKLLDIEIVECRDKMAPGEEATIKLLIKNKAGLQTNYEVAAAMYDASLDAFLEHSWSTILFPGNYASTTVNGYDFGQKQSIDLNYLWNQINYSQGGFYLPIPSLIALPSFYANDSRMMQRSVMKTSSVMEEPVLNESAPQGAPSEIKAESGAATYRSTDDIAIDKKVIRTDEEEKTTISPRTNLKETVFFYPHLMTGQDGKLEFKFKNNEALTKWKLILFAHDKGLANGYQQKMVATYKDVTIQANSPRFLRKGDELYFTARVSNLSDKEITADVNLGLLNMDSIAVSGLITDPPMKKITLKKGESKTVAWQLNTSDQSPDLLRYIVSVKSGKYTDAETSILPVISNKILVTETMPMYIKGNSKKSYAFSSFKNATSTQVPHKYVIEVSSNPVWYAIQAMPYLINQDNDNSMALVDRLYVNALSNHIGKLYPEIESVYKQWQEKDRDALKSKLQKNEDLKNVQLDETPWVRDAIDEAMQTENIARLFDKNTVDQDIKQTLERLKMAQLQDGSFGWYYGGRSNYYSTLYVVGTLGKIKDKNLGLEVENIANPAIQFLQADLTRQYEELKLEIEKSKGNINDYQPSGLTIYHLYSMMLNSAKSEIRTEAFNFYYKQALKYWMRLDMHSQSLLGIVDLRLKGSDYLAIKKSFLQKSFKSDELGTYWNDGNGFKWYELPIERHASLMEFLNETKLSADELDEMKIWLLKNKQGNKWNNSKATTAAISALLLTDGRAQTNLKNKLFVTTKIGDINLPADAQVQAGTAYYKQSWEKNEIKKSMADILMVNPSSNIAWGAAFYQYFEDVDKVKGSVNTSPLKITKELYKKVVDGKGFKLVPISESKLAPGDLIVSRLIITTDRGLDYISLKDVRASGLEPTNVLSQYKWSGGFGYYESTRDQANHYYIDHLPKGTHVFESVNKIVHRGSYSGGLATIQSIYAPEFSSKTEGNRIVVK